MPITSWPRGSSALPSSSASSTFECSGSGCRPSRGGDVHQRPSGVRPKLVLFASALKNNVAPGTAATSSRTSRSHPGSGSAVGIEMVGLPKGQQLRARGRTPLRWARRAAMLIDGAIEIGLRSIRYSRRDAAPGTAGVQRGRAARSSPACRARSRAAPAAAARSYRRSPHSGFSDQRVPVGIHQPRPDRHASVPSGTSGSCTPSCDSVHATNRSNSKSTHYHPVRREHRLRNAPHPAPPRCRP